jgi:hypothetical protein
MTLTDPNARRSTVARLVAEPEAVAAAPLAFAPREPDPAAVAHGGLGLGMGGECPTKVDRGLLEHLRGDRVPPPQARHLLDDGAVRGNDKQPASLLGLLPSIERLDQVESGPRYPDLRVYPLDGKGVGDQPKALVVGESRRPSMAGERRRLRGGRSKGKPEGRWCAAWHSGWYPADVTVGSMCSSSSRPPCAKAPPPRPTAERHHATRDSFDRLGQSPTRPAGEVNQVHPGEAAGGSPGACREPAKDSPRRARDRPWTDAGTSLHFATVSTGGLNRKP